MRNVAIAGVRAPPRLRLGCGIGTENAFRSRAESAPQAAPRAGPMGGAQKRRERRMENAQLGRPPAEAARARDAPWPGHHEPANAPQEVRPEAARPPTAAMEAMSFAVTDRIDNPLIAPARLSGTVVLT